MFKIYMRGISKEPYGHNTAMFSRKTITIPSNNFFAAG